MNARAVVMVLAIAACGDEAARVQLVPVNPCGATANKTAMRVIAYTAGAEVRRSVPPLDIDAFPADTEQLGVEVIGQAGALIAIGKTAPLSFNSLSDGTAIPIVMAPPDGLCPVGPMSQPRVAPLVARAGGGVLVAGGRGMGGEPLSTADYYDPATTTFTPVDVPGSLVDADNGLGGAVLTELPDGRVALTGTASHALALFSATDRTFTTPTLFDRRAFHGAIASDADHLFVIGGCEDVSSGACAGSAVLTSYNYNVAKPTERTPGPMLSALRSGSRVFDLGVQRDGAHRYVLATETGDGDRFALTDGATEPISGLHAQHALLDGGGLLTAFDAALSGAAGVLVPDGSVVPIAPAPKVDGERLIALEDGSTLAIGPTIARYHPTTNTWTVLAATTPGSPALIRLLDGTVLVLGGDTASAQAWIFRPSLVGPSSGSITAFPDGSTEGVLVPSDPSAVDRVGARFALVGTDDDYRVRALVGGPHVADASITAVVRMPTAGVALVAQQTGPGRAIVGRLVPGEAARIEQLDGGTPKPLCSGSQVEAGELATVGLAIAGGEATLTVGAPGATTVKASCSVTANDRGAWGIATAGSGARFEVGPITVERTR